MPKAALMPKTVDDVLTEFEKKHDLKIGTPDRVTGMPTGNLGIDWQTGVGGLPIGRITELYGYESSGKTTTALQTAVMLQQDILERSSDQRIVYLDFEHALDVDYARQLGLDLEHRSFVPLQPNNLEQGANVALDLIETGKVPLIVFDSVAAMSPKRLKEGEFDQATIQMHRAKLISALCQSMVDLIWEKKVTAVFVNHRMESIEMTGRPGLPPKTTTPGGRGLKYYASLRLEFDIVGAIKNKIEDFLTLSEVNQAVASKVMVRCVKNKVGVPGRVVELRSRYGMGFDNAWSALVVLEARKLITRTGAYYNLAKSKTPLLVDTGDKFQIHGEQAVLDYADNNPLWREHLIQTAVEALRTSDEGQLHSLVAESVETE
jgi:recombination protein RecA